MIKINDEFNRISNNEKSFLKILLNLYHKDIYTILFYDNN